MKPTIPVNLNFMQKARNGFEIQGKWPLNQLKRLDDALLSTTGEVEVSLRFDRAGHIPFIEGHIETSLSLRCQRCMQPMEYPVKHDFKLGLVLNEKQIDQLPDEYEPYLVEDESNYIADLLEDELLLALPLVAMHDYDCADIPQQQGTEQSDEVDPGEKTHNPFASLKDLLK